MPRKDYSEDILIQQPTAELLEKELKWDSVSPTIRKSSGLIVCWGGTLTGKWYYAGM